jgi:hypothetical protein
MFLNVLSGRHGFHEAMSPDASSLRHVGSHEDTPDTAIGIRLGM